MPTDNSRLVFAFGNQWTKEKEAAPFFGLPAWWRRFIFQILTPREVTVYLYLCSVMDPNAIAYPTVEQIAEDMAVKSRSVVAEALSRLVERGFLLRGSEPYNGRIMGKRIIYQRPLPHYTILHLLKAGLIDSDLYPTDNQTRDAKLTAASDDVVRAGLKRLLGDTNYLAYQRLTTSDRRKRALIAALEEHVTKVTEATRAKLVEKISATEMTEFMKNLPPSMRAIVEEENGEGVPF